MQPEPRLGLENAAHGALDLRPWKFAALDGANHRRHRRRRIRRIENHVDPRRRRPHRGLARRQHLRDRRHLHRVGIDEPVEAHLAAEQAANHLRAERGRPLLGIDGRQLDVRHHHAGRAGGDAGPERRQLDGIEARAGMRNDRQPEMRVDIGVAVPRKMLERGEHAGVLHAPHPAGHHGAHASGILAERSDVDHRVARVVVDVGHGAEVHVHAHGPALGAGDLPRFVGQPRIAGRAERHGPRELRRARNAHPRAPLEIGRGQERKRRHRLQPVEQRGQLHRLPEDDGRVRRVEHHLRHRLSAAEGDHAADVRLVNQLHQRVVRRRITTEVGGVERGEDHLPDQLLEGQLPERRLNPLLSGLVERRLRNPIQTE